MQTIFGVLGVSESDSLFVNTVGQSIIYDATGQILGDHNADMAASMAAFVEGDTENYKVRYKLPGSGRLQKLNRNGRPLDVKAYGSWDVAFPLEEWGDGLAGDRVSLAKMSVQQYQLHLETIVNRDRNTVRAEMLKALFNNTARVFKDEEFGDLTVQPLANNDAVKYPPLVGAEDPAVSDHYLISGYVSADISDAKNPIPRIVARLEGHFGKPTGGSNIVVFVNNAEIEDLEALQGFKEAPNRFVRYGVDESLVEDGTYPAGLPGRVIGTASGALIVNWDWVPSGYLLGIHLDAPKPLMQRVDPAVTGLPRGLQLVAREQHFPFSEAIWTHRFGFGVGNRLNGVIMQLKASGSYDIPAIYQ